MSILCLFPIQDEDLQIEDLSAELPAHEPRYIALSYCYKHDDGRVSYPLVFIFISPQGRDEREREREKEITIAAMMQFECV